MAAVRMMDSLLLLHVMFTLSNAWDCAVNYNKQLDMNMTCAAKITYNAKSTKCARRCNEKYKDMCRGFVATGSTCELCIVCQENDQQLLLAGNLYVAEPLINEIMKGERLLSICEAHKFFTSAERRRICFRFRLSV